MVGVFAAAALFGAVSSAQGQREIQGDASPVSSPIASPVASPVATITIEISRFAFQTETLEIPVGTTVTWVNKDMAPHTVTHAPESGEAAFDSGLFVPGESWSHTFNTPGTFNYYCIPHPNMVAQVIVT